MTWMSCRPSTFIQETFDGRQDGQDVLNFIEVLLVEMIFAVVEKMNSGFFGLFLSDVDERTGRHARL